MNAKHKTLYAAAGAGCAGFINWLATVPPEQQSGWLATLVEITPVEYRPNVGLASRFAMLFLGIYATYRAAHSSNTIQ